MDTRKTFLRIRGAHGTLHYRIFYWPSSPNKINVIYERFLTVKGDKERESSFVLNAERGIQHLISSRVENIKSRQFGDTVQSKLKTLSIIFCAICRTNQVCLKIALNAKLDLVVLYWACTEW